MALTNLELARAQVDLLTSEEQRELAAYLLSKGKPKHSAVKDLNDLRGTIKLSVDPIQYQSDSRAERS